MSRVVVPFYSAKAASAMAVLRMDKLYQDHEERGFFKLGFLPVWVGEEATLEIKDVAATRDAMERFHGWHHPPGGKRRLEWHHLMLYNLGSDGARLQAGRARLETDGRCRLFEGVDYQADGKTWQAEEACLTMAGPHTGELILFRFAAPVRLHWPGTGSDNSREQAAKHKEDYEP